MDELIPRRGQIKRNDPAEHATPCSYIQSIERRVKEVIPERGQKTRADGRWKSIKGSRFCCFWLMVPSGIHPRCYPATLFFRGYCVTAARLSAEWSGYHLEKRKKLICSVFICSNIDLYSTLLVACHDEESIKDKNQTYSRKDRNHMKNDIWHIDVTYKFEPSNIDDDSLLVYIWCAKHDVDKFTLRTIGC
jgi:hypothetical protein